MPPIKLQLLTRKSVGRCFASCLYQLNVPDPDALATQLMILGEGAVAQALVHGDPKMARAAREAARVLLTATGVHVPASISLTKVRAITHGGVRRARQRTRH